MAIIPQKQLFQWSEVEELGDLHRLGLLLDYLPDESLMRTLEVRRGRTGRDDYPIRPVWNSLLAAVVFQHKGVEPLRRELSRNAQLRQMCGFDVTLGAKAVPSEYAYSRFLRTLREHEDSVDLVFELLVHKLARELPDFGRELAIDGKAIATHGRPRRKDHPELPADGRRDTDADWGVKKTTKTNAKGESVTCEFRWFGYKLHLIVDTVYELPVAFSVTRASVAEQPEGRRLVKQLSQRQRRLVQRCEAASGDRGYDDTELITLLWDDFEIKPVIGIRDCWRDGEETRRVSTTRNVVYDHQGHVSCCCMSDGTLRSMAYAGFEKDRGTLKYRCPALHYSRTCPDLGRCAVKKAVRIKLSEDRRVFTPLARSSYAWQRHYKKRTAVERVNSRLDVSFGFEEHFIRGQKKMKLRLSLAMIVMLGMAYGRIKEKQKDKVRSLVRAA